MPESLQALPFLPVFHGPVRDGVKTATCRTKKYGEAGDLLQGPGVVLRLLHVERLTLHDVQRYHWRDEGVESPEAFAEIWRKIHPGRGFVPDDRVWFHRFEVAHDA